VIRRSWESARAVAAAAGSPLPAEAVPLDRAAGRVLADDVRAQDDVPHYASSAMDGWAVRGDGPWTAWSDIVTGGLVPEDADRVLPHEDGVLRGGVLAVRDGAAAPVPGRHVRPAGEEARAGDVLVARGTRLGPVHAAVAASAGVDVVTVHARPAVRLVLTGDEVDLTGRPRPGRVRDSFGPMLPAAVTALGGRVAEVLRVADVVDAVADALDGAPDRPAGPDHPDGPGGPVDLVVTTGGTGGSPVDPIRPALAAAELLVDGVAMRPGAPTMLARLPGGPLVLALPGNPLAAMAALVTLGGPLIAGLAGIPAIPNAAVRVNAPIEGRGGRTRLVAARVVEGVAVPTGHQGAGMLRGLAEADAFLIVPGDGLAAGAAAAAVLLPW